MGNMVTWLSNQLFAERKDHKDEDEDEDVH